ncbi:DEAD/DEAH box helicase [Cohnella faecalis]|uniref:DEAD/DEAH box helicase n=1 Tax=Cohnella faecalis TaxID=2315694 RepID=UPI001F1BFAB9|nr:DEAD/DEAH box helicase [Cohnella faecalis]
MTTLKSLSFHPVVSEWFSESFGEPTDVQLQAWSAAMDGRHTLIAAPTGSGKTLAALLPCLDKLVRAKLEKSDEAGAAAGWHPGVRILYITPLRALNNDILHHVARFTEELDGRAARSGRPWPGVRCAVRTGDTSSAARASMLKRPPDVLVTTPESLYILLTSQKGSAMLGTVRHVIVDEIHDMAADKRGSHLTLSLERLEWVCRRPVQRIGVSATQKALGTSRPISGRLGAFRRAGRHGTPARLFSACGNRCRERDGKGAERIRNDARPEQSRIVPRASVAPAA